MTMLTYACDLGHAFIDRRLYLPETWAWDPTRRATAGVPAEVTFATKPAQAVEMLTDALDAGVGVDFLAADSAYGRDRRLRRACHERGLPYVVEVPVNEAVSDAWGARWADDFLARTGEDDWERRSCGHGAKGERYYDWACHGGVCPGGQDPTGGFCFSLLLRRSVADPTEVAYFLAHHRPATPIPTLISVAGTRWRIEEDNEHGKTDVGLGQYEVRKWGPWHKHVTACMFALAYLATTRVGELGKPRCRRRRGHGRPVSPRDPTPARPDHPDGRAGLRGGHRVVELAATAPETSRGKSLSSQG
jgi:SRSO17 transposase